MTTVAEMAKLETQSREWFDAAFEGVDVPEYIKTVAAVICHSYDINGQADPGYIANIIQQYITLKPSKCPKTATGCHFDHKSGENCIWCFGQKN